MPKIYSCNRPAEQPVRLCENPIQSRMIEHKQWWNSLSTDYGEDSGRLFLTPSMPAFHPIPNVGVNVYHRSLDECLVKKWSDGNQRWFWDLDPPFLDKRKTWDFFLRVPRLFVYHWSVGLVAKSTAASPDHFHPPGDQKCIPGIMLRFRRLK